MKSTSKICSAGIKNVILTLMICKDDNQPCIPELMHYLSPSHCYMDEAVLILRIVLHYNTVTAWKWLLTSRHCHPLTNVYIWGRVPCNRNTFHWYVYGKGLQIVFWATWKQILVCSPGDYYTTAQLISNRTTRNQLWLDPDMYPFITKVHTNFQLNMWKCEERNPGKSLHENISKFKGP